MKQELQNDHKDIMGNEVTLGSNLTYLFNGLITDLNIWNRPLATDDVIKFSKCQNTDLIQNLPVSWRNATKTSFSSSKAINISMDEICPAEPLLKYILFKPPGAFTHLFW